MSDVPSQISTLLQSVIASSLSNLTSSRFQHPSQHSRLEGWTEVFGNVKSNEKKDKDDEENINYWEAEDNFVRQTRETHLKQASGREISLHLSQYRVAWQEQLVLRIYKIPHLILNAPHVATESTGALPSLVDLGQRAIVGRSMVKGRGGKGEDKISITTCSRSDIVDYLMMEEKIEFADATFTAAQKAQSLLCTGIIENELTAILLALRFGDSNTWNDIYRKQCIKASLDPNSEMDVQSFNESQAKNSFFEWVPKLNHFGGFFNFSAWSERAVSLKELTLSNSISNRTNLFQKNTKEVNVENAISMAKSCYQALDFLLGQQSKNQNGLCLLLGTEIPSIVDTILFAHLAEALCDVHLITVLVEFKNLVEFFKTMYETYFGKEYIQKVNEESSQDDCSWINWNNIRNTLNQFNRIPIGNDYGERGQSKVTSQKSYNDAIQIMQSVALHCHDLQEVLVSVSTQRIEEKKLLLTNKKDNVEEMLHRFRMGGELRDSSRKEGKTIQTSGVHKRDKRDGHNDDQDFDEITRKNKERMKKILREAKKNDQLWISGVVVSSLFAFTLAAAKANAAGSMGRR